MAVGPSSIHYPEQCEEIVTIVHRGDWDESAPSVRVTVSKLPGATAPDADHLMQALVMLAQHTQDVLLFAGDEK